jgi:ABC-type transporter Mla maintaining outer membrane lipid asymmetry permease subunit MlaE
MINAHKVLGVVVTGLLLAGALASADGRLRQAAAAQPPVVGDMAHDFSLSRLDGKTVTLSSLRKSGPVVVLMLRGWVGYQ